jgi:hypothetical protein
MEIGRRRGARRERRRRLRRRHNFVCMCMTWEGDIFKLDLIHLVSSLLLVFVTHLFSFSSLVPLPISSTCGYRRVSHALTSSMVGSKRHSTVASSTAFPQDVDAGQVTSAIEMLIPALKDLDGLYAHNVSH